MNRARIVAALAVAACAACSKPAPPTERSSSSTADAAATENIWPAAGPGRHPGLLLLHGAGGPALFSDTNLSHHYYPEYFAAHGYMVVMPHLPRTGDGLAAARAALDKLVGRSDVDQIAVVGFSRGAFVGLRLAAADMRVGALVEFYGFLPDHNAAEITRMPPTLILHGEKDPDVKIEEAHKLQRLFRAKHIDFEDHFYPGEEHGFDPPAMHDSARRAVEFLDARIHRDASGGPGGPGGQNPIGSSSSRRSP